MIGLIISRLRQAPAIFRSLDGVVAFSRIENDPPLQLRPAGWVMPIRESAGPSIYAANAVGQDVQERVGIIACLGDGKTTSASAEADVIRTMRDKLIDRLVGWRPETADGQLLYGGGALLRAEARAIYWQFDFTRVASIRKV